MNERIVPLGALVLASVGGWAWFGSASPKASAGAIASADAEVDVEVAAREAERAPIVVVEPDERRVAAPARLDDEEAQPSLDAARPAARPTRDLTIQLDRLPSLTSPAAATVELIEWAEVPGGRAFSATAPIEAERAHFASVPTAVDLVLGLRLPRFDEPLQQVVRATPGAERSLEIIRVDVADLIQRSAAPVATLRSIAAAQQQLQASAAIDTDADGGGEFGYFAELAGTVPIRLFDASRGPRRGGPGEPRLDPTYLPRSFGAVVPGSGGGVLERSGYYYRIVLPGPDTAPVGHPSRCEGIAEAVEGGAAEGLPDSAAAELYWCCYAWPKDERLAARTTYFINQSGDVIGRREAPYVGLHGGPSVDAAFSQPNNIASEPGLVAMGRSATDGGAWMPVGN